MWENPGKDGGVYYTVSFQRTYTVPKEDGSGGKDYRRTNQLRQQDLLLAAELMRLAWYKIRALEKDQ